MRLLPVLMATMVAACGSTGPSEAPPRTHIDLTARLVTPTGESVEGVLVVIKTWPPADDQTERTFTGFLTSDADGVASRTAGPFAGGVIDSFRVFANPPAACRWNPVEFKVDRIVLDTVASGGVEVTVEVPDTLAPARTELGGLCAQGTEMPSGPGLLSYDLHLEIEAVAGGVFSGSWRLGSAFYSPARGSFSATVAGGAVGMLLTPTTAHPLCSEIRLLGTIAPDGSWSRMEVVTQLIVPNWPCVPAGHRYRFYRTELAALP